MWIDFKNGVINPQDIILLQLIHQNQKEDLRYEVETHLDALILDEFHTKGWVEFIKAKNKADTLQNRARLTKHGKQLLENLQTPPVSEEDEKVAVWLIDKYKRLGKDIGNGKKLRRHIRDFRHASGIEKNNLVMLVLNFLQEHEDQSRVLEYVFYYPKTVFATRFDIEDSWLYKHYLKKEEYFKSIFEKY